MALTDEHWEKVLRGIAQKGRGLELDTQGSLELIKEHWELFGDESALDIFLGDDELVELKKQSTEQTQALADLDAEIARREGGR